MLTRYLIPVYLHIQMTFEIFKHSVLNLVLR